MTLGPLLLARQPDRHLVCDLGVARPGRRRCRGGFGSLLAIARVRAARASAWRRCSTTCRTRPCAGAMRCAGGVFVAVGMSSRQARCWPGTSAPVPTYSMVYGAFATVPIFLVWIYLGWVVVLLGAVIAAYAPSLSACAWCAGPTRRAAASSWRSSVLRELAGAREAGARGHRGRRCRDGAAHRSAAGRAGARRRWSSIDWVGRLDEAGDAALRAARAIRRRRAPSRWSPSCCSIRRPTSRRSGSAPASAGCASRRSWTGAAQSA